MQKDAEKYVSRRNLLLQKKEDCIRSIRELGVLPEEAFEKYKNVASQKVRNLDWLCYIIGSDKAALRCI